jgi:hypothetical protein
MKNPTTAPAQAPAPPRTYSGRMSARQILEALVGTWALVAFLVVMLSILVFDASFYWAGIRAAVLGLAAAGFVGWAMLSDKPVGYSLYPDRLVVKRSNPPEGGSGETSLFLRDVGHLGYDGRRCVLRSGPRREEVRTIVMRPEEMADLFEHLSQYRSKVEPALPYSVTRYGDMRLSDPYVLERDPERLSGELRVTWSRDSDGWETGQVDQGPKTPVLSVIETGGGNYWVLRREDEREPRLGICEWSIQSNEVHLDVFDVRGVHVAQSRGRHAIEVRIDARLISFSQEGECEVAREGDRVLLEFHGWHEPRVVLPRPLPRTFVELLILVHAASHRASLGD